MRYTLERDDDDTFVPVDECAERMGLTVAEVMDLVKRKALRARRYGAWGQLEVQPAITNAVPRKAPAKSKRSPLKRPRSR
jgi:hypothetical protein